MHRVVILATLVVLFGALSLAPTRAGASSVSDPNDVWGPFDVRRLQANYTPTAQLRIVITFYHGFRVRALPNHVATDQGIYVGLQKTATGYFVRRASGRIVLIWGDFGSSCGFDQRNCNRDLVTRRSLDVFSVTIDPSLSDPFPYNIHLETFWHAASGRLVKDVTEHVSLGLPPGRKQDSRRPSGQTPPRVVPISNPISAQC